MKLAYLITLHRLERQFEWLLRALWNKDDLFVLHVSRTAPQSYDSAIRVLTAGLPNVHFLPRVPITWGGWSLVETTLRAIRLLCRCGDDWRYFINLSGQDYPVRPVNELRKFLRQRNRTSFVDARHIDTQPFHIRRRLHWYCFEGENGVRRVPVPNVRAMRAGVEWYGALWGIFHREFCEWLIASERTEFYCRALHYTKCPDEFFFQTMIMRSPFASTLDPDPRRYIEFEVGAANPKILTTRDLAAMLGSSAFFARKFDEASDGEVLKRLAERIGASSPELMPEQPHPWPEISAIPAL